MIPVSLGVGDDRTGLDFGANNPSDLSGSVWIDLDNDDARDAGETDPIPDVSDIEIVLLDNAGNEIARTNLDANGDFTFTDLPAGAYAVEVDEGTLPDTPTNFNLTAPNGEDVVLGVDDDRAGIEFGINAIGVIGDTVWLDADEDGVIDAGRTGPPRRCSGAAVRAGHHHPRARRCRQPDRSDHGHQRRVPPRGGHRR